MDATKVDRARVFDERPDEDRVIIDLSPLNLTPGQHERLARDFRWLDAVDRVTDGDRLCLSRSLLHSFGQFVNFVWKKLEERLKEWGLPVPECALAAA